MANIFKNFDNCINNRGYDAEAGFSSWQFCRYLAGSIKMINYANAINCYSNQFSDANQWGFIQSVKSKPKFIRWLIPKTNDNDSPELEEIMRKYNITKDKAIEYTQILKDLK